jgi:3-oxoacyl-[acyl-carrier-protein] synthase-1
LLCLAELERPGRIERQDEDFLDELQRDLGVRFHSELSMTIAQGRVGCFTALYHARKLLTERRVTRVLVAATDSLLVGPTLAQYDSVGRLLTPANSNGFIPGEGATAILVGAAEGGPELLVRGIGFAQEKATVHSEEPLRADGLTHAMKAALSDARSSADELDFRITDTSGEQYYFKEAALAMTRILPGAKADFDFWHPADCIGDTGAAAGASMFALALASCTRGFAPGPNILLHASNDSGMRASAILRFSGAT